MSGGEWIKAATSAVAPEKTQAEIITVLARYRASGFGFRRRGSVIEATFHIPRDGGEEATVRIPVDVAVVRKRLDAIWAAPDRPHTKKPDDFNRQAERTAWRALLTWIEASLLAVKLGAQSMEEAFFAHLVVQTGDGERRLVEYMHELSIASGGKLPAPSAPRLISGAAA